MNFFLSLREASLTTTHRPNKQVLPLLHQRATDSQTERGRGAGREREGGEREGGREAGRDKEGREREAGRKRERYARQNS